MMDTQPLVDLSPLGLLMLKGIAIAALPLAWVWARNRHAEPARRLRALTLLTLFLTFDLVLFGAFTRLTDSGLGCPDWPGCYGAASPLGAKAEITAAQIAMPTGPVTHGKAWIEMVPPVPRHRRRRAHSHVGRRHVVGTARSCQPAGVVALVARDDPRVGLRAGGVWRAHGDDEAVSGHRHHAPAGRVDPARLVVCAGRALCAGGGCGPRVDWQPYARAVAHDVRGAVAAGGAGRLVSTNYAVLACSEFPMCQASWWPP